MFAIAAMFMLLGAWTLVICLLDWDPSLGVFDLQALGEALGHDTARWVIGGTGAIIFMAGLLAAW